ncbi:mercury resistance system transport protein MerF [Rhodovarius lipocyclicus]|uniref:mercury resistance system transport protein MerF n=1 Tax=Rhodovarius lipocyclicus TaxID=268410 RepID=UPI0013587701|nr:mercury resistance system transport protein MerF [Rhodovarius lipocyclicus]
MNDRTLIRTGAIGAGLAAICCATPILAIVLGAAGLSAWAAGADSVLIPILLACLALVAIGLVRRQRARTCCAPGETTKEGRP